MRVFLDTNILLDVLMNRPDFVANANKFPHIRRINALLGCATPQLITPLELLDNETD